MTSQNVYIEISHDSLRALAGEDGLVLPLERLESRRLHPACGETIAAGLREFLKKHGARPGQRALCAIGARGVSLRRLTLPTAPKGELQRLLLLQIEREFPLAPEELAWGYRVLANGSGKSQELLVVAVKKEVVQEYSDLLAAGGLSPEFTLGALARSSLALRPPASYAVLDVGRTDAELICFENGAPVSIRILPWTESPDRAALESLTKTIQSSAARPKIYLSGESGRLHDLALKLAGAPGVECERIETPHGDGRSAAILGLKKSCEDGVAPPLWLRLQPSGGKTEIITRPVPWKWAALAGLLLLILFSLRYAEAFIQRPRLAQRLAETKGYRDKLPQVDRELSFLQYLKTNQPPYLDPLFTMANASPGGARIESLSMNRRGDLALRAMMANSQQVGDFRSKLINSGFFSTVVVEEQTPTPDKQKVVVRITAQWKPSGDGKSPASESPRSEASKAGNPVQAVPTALSTNAPALPANPTNPPASRKEMKE